MKEFLKKYGTFLLTLLFLMLAVVLENGFFSSRPGKAMTDRFQEKLIEKETLLDRHLDQIAEQAAQPGFCDNFLHSMAPWNNILEKEGLGFLIYRHQKLFYWSDRSVAFREVLPLSVEPDAPVVHFPNGYYLVRSRQIDSLAIYGLILLKYDYSHENQYLRNHFFEGSGLPATFRLARAGATTGFDIAGRDGQPLFSIIPAGENLHATSWSWLPGILYLAALLLTLAFARKTLAGLSRHFLVRSGLMLLLLLLIYRMHIHFRIPGLFGHTDLFSPSHFALSTWLPSLGDFLLLALFFFFFMVTYYRDLRISALPGNRTFIRRVAPGLLLLLAAGLFFITDDLIRKLIYNSSFSFTLNRINEITIQTVLGIGAMMFLLFGLLLLIVRTTGEARRVLPLKLLLPAILAAPLLPALLQFLLQGAVSLPAMALFLASALLATLLAGHPSRRYGMTYLVLFLVAITLYSIGVIYHITVKKEREVQKLMAGTLVAEHDPAAEVFLVDIQEQISTDPNIPQYLIPPFDKLDEYLETTYFSGFFRQYDLQITICTGADSLTLHPQNVQVPCFPFFEEMISNQGMQLPGTQFYYLDNMDGRITYLGKIHYPLSADSIGVSIFIDLKSRILSEGIGFPELLIDKSMRKPASYKRFNYAKYYGGELVDRHGEYPYNYYIYSYSFDDREFSYNIWDGYEHLIHRTREDNYVIVSRSLYTFVDYLISFPYLFSFYFLFSLAALVLIQPGLRRKKILFDLKFRIQAAIIAIVFISLLVVAVSTILYNLEESEARLREDLDRKMNSVALEIDMRLENAALLTPEMREWLMPELVKLSNVFETDINIYGVGGNLVVSSRPEIFSRGLVSERINAQAWYELFENFQTNYFQPEKIGGLSYLSAYEPIINNSGDYLGFINLPYFTHQDKYSQEISTFIVAFINLYVLLFLASMAVAVLIANQITLPLATIRENLRKMEFGKRNEPLSYSRNDEIGKLVREYNRKVDELAVSAELLARSERESAWREMAKQVAHEIKNPLTPMKLNIQHLQRFRGEGEDYRNYVNRIARNLIDQIDTLSEIATEFSNFAQIPRAMKQVFNLNTQISKVIDLYENHDRIHISFDQGDCRHILVNADREQLSRALINLIKNGIQSIPDDRPGKIAISVKRREHMVVISVADNGSGIPEELREKMFSPSFTTKSSGMGLGLAIVKNIAENFNGRVWYDTVVDEGTTFYIEIPVQEGEEPLTGPVNGAGN